MLNRNFFVSLLVVLLWNNGLAQYSSQVVKQLRAKLAQAPDSAVGKVYSRLFLEFYSHSAFDSARALAIEVEERARKLHDRKFESTALVWQGMIDFEKGNYEDALSVYLRALKIKEEIKDLKGEASLLMNMAGIYYERNYNKKAVELYTRALELKIALGDKIGQANIYVNLGNTAESEAHVRQKQGKQDEYKALLREALNYYGKSELLDRDLRDSISVAVVDRSLANVYAQLGNIREAERLAYSAYKYLRLKNDRNFIGALLVLGKVHLQKGSYYKSSDYLEEAYQTAQKNSMPFLAKEASENLAKVYLSLKQYEKSIYYQKRYSRINDSLQSADIGKQLAHMQVRYETERKEKAIEHLELENSKKELELTRKRDQVILITSVFVCIMAVFIAFYFYSNAKKQHLINLVKQRRHKEIVETIITTEEKARKKIAADLHDGLGQILTAAKINLANLNEAMPQQREKLQQVTELVNSAQYESKNMALNLMPLTLKENGLVESIKRICVKYNKPEVQEISFTAYDVPDQLEPVVEINTYRICQELLNNAVKYSKAAKIFLQLFCREGKLIIQIEDNGIGFDKTKTKADSLGMNTLKERVALLNGEIEIDTAPEKGTNIFIELSLH